MNAARAPRELVQVIDSGPSIPILEGPGQARAVIWPGIGASMRSMHHLSLSVGARTVKLRHPGEAVYYVIRGTGHVQDADAGAQSLSAGMMFLVEAETTYVVVADSEELELVGGPCPPDRVLYSELQTDISEDR